MELKVNDKVMVFDNYDRRDIRRMAITTITKIDEKKGWYYTPLGKFKGSKFTDARLVSVSEKSLVHLRYKAHDFILDGEGYTFYKADESVGFDADYITPFDEEKFRIFKVQQAKYAANVHAKLAKIERNKVYMDRFQENKAKLEEDLQRRIALLFTINICTRCKKVTECKLFNENDFYINENCHGGFDAEEE